MKKNLAITIIQSNPVWEDAKSNMRIIDKLLEEVPVATDLVIFSEMLLTGFSMNIDKITEPMTGDMVNWMRDTAYKSNIAIIGTLPIIENNKCYNRLLFVMPDKQLF